MLNYITLRPDKITTGLVESPEYYWSEKMDGHFLRCVFDNGECSFFSKMGKLVSLPHVKIEQPSGVSELYGELIYKDVEATSNALVSKFLASDSTALQFAVFSGKREDDNLTISEFSQIDIQGMNVFKVNWQKVASRTSISEAFDSVMNNDGEGIVVALDSGFVYKIKPLIHLDLVILGYSMGVGEKAGIIRDVLVGICKNEYEYTIIGRTSLGIIGNSELQSQLSGLACQSEYVEVSSAKTAFIFLQPKLVGEFTCLDVQDQNSKEFISKPTLFYDDNLGYKVKGNSASVSIYSMVFKSLRLDKSPSIEDSGWSQLSSYISERENGDQEETLSSEVVLREVYSKDSKNGTAVRKLLILKTNKDSTGTFSAYNSFYTDFSPGRKSPMETDIYLHDTIEQAKAKIDGLREENIKKGWVKLN